MSQDNDQKSEQKPEQTTEQDSLTEERIQEMIDSLCQEAEMFKAGKHPRTLKLIEVLDAARLRQYANAEIRRELSVNYAKQTLHFTRREISSDYTAGKDDLKEKVYADLRKKKKDLRDVIDRLQEHGEPMAYENACLNDIKIPNKKRDRRSFRGSYNFKLPEPEARQDLAIIQSFAEEMDQYRR